MAIDTLPYIGPLVTRKDAKARGLKRYFTGKRCPYGHIAERRTSRSGCIICEREWREAHPEPSRAKTPLPLTVADRLAGLTDADLAYAAGLFDGEGCISLEYSKYAKRHYLKCTIAQNRPEAIKWIGEKFGGRVQYQETRFYRRWHWCASARRGACFLLALQPYLKVKAEEVQVALEFARTINPHTGRKYLAPQVVAAREGCRLKIREIRGRWSFTKAFLREQWARKMEREDERYSADQNI